jgi:hypothetical protein
MIGGTRLEERSLPVRQAGLGCGGRQFEEFRANAETAGQLRSGRECEQSGVHKLAVPWGAHEDEPALRRGAFLIFWSA